MGHVVGIDLGTCYSAIVVPEQRAGGGFLTIRACPGYSVVLDSLKRRITPSVVAEDDNGNITVGYEAKGRAGLAPEPIMFAKRWMGEEKTFPLGRHGQLRPEEVAAHVLRYLKQLAEAQLGEPVEEAVITVPAYFTLSAKQMTEKAAQLAGLRVAQIAQEPVAAALMYCQGDARDPLRILTYDLGGGTYDVAILEKKDGIISTASIKAFDGDRFLGGYNFDLALAFWIMDRLDDQGYDLRLNPDLAQDRVPFAKLLIYAERAKIRLSELDTVEIDEHSTGIVDRRGRPVSIKLTVTRGEFEDLIRPQIEYTVALCRRALQEKATPPIAPGQIDEIIMVGGSSRIPLIGRMLEAEFGRKPRLIEPDLCVALGAAILARAKSGTALECLKLDPIPAETELTTLTLTGKVVPGPKLASTPGCTVALRALDGSFNRRLSPGPDGAFAFDGVPLAPQDKTEFVLTVTSPAGAEVATHRFTVTQTEKAKPGGLVEAVTNVLSKPISILWLTGAEVVAPVRTALPFETVVHGETTDTSGEVRIAILEENTPLGEIHMRDIPKTLPVGSAIEISLSIKENYQIRGRAYLPALARETTTVIHIPVRAQKTLQELERDFEDLRAKAEDSLAAAPPGSVFALSGRVRTQLRRCEQLLRERQRDPAAIQDAMDEVRGALRELGAEWKPDPPRSIFDHKACEAQELLDRVIQAKPEVRQDGFDKQLQAIRAEADKAYQARNSAGWQESYKRVEKLCEQLERLTPGPGPGRQLDPMAKLLILSKELERLVDWAKEKKRYTEFEAEFRELAASLKRIDPKAPDADTQMWDWYSTKFGDLRQRLAAPATRGIPKPKGGR